MRAISKSYWAGRTAYLRVPAAETGKGRQMSWRLWPLVVGWALITTLPGQATALEQALSRFLEQAPLAVEYRYLLSGDDLQREFKGTIYLAGPAVFRLEIWDKVYAADGALLYLHDLNTHQTVIDSLRWSEVNLWIGLLNGELPPKTRVTPLAPGEGPTGYLIESLSQPWTATALIDTTSGLIETIIIREYDSGWDHRISFLSPTAWEAAARDTFFTLLDLPGIRLDLR